MKKKDKRNVDWFKILDKTEKYSSLKRGKIINLATQVESTLTDILAHIFYPGRYTPDIESTKLLVKQRVELKSLLLSKIDFRDKIESLNNAILVKKPEALENNRIFIKTLVKELNEVRKFRNLIAHSELELFSNEFIRELINDDVSGKINRFPIIRYKKGKATIHLISEEEIDAEIKRMKGVLEKLRILHTLIQGHIKLSSDYI
jgi:hypothetical protein